MILIAKVPQRRYEIMTSIHKKNNEGLLETYLLTLLK